MMKHLGSFGSGSETRPVRQLADVAAALVYNYRY
jgi:hypothetical protein